MRNKEIWKALGITYSLCLLSLFLSPKSFSPLFRDDTTVQFEVALIHNNEERKYHKKEQKKSSPHNTIRGDRTDNKTTSSATIIEQTTLLAMMNDTDRKESNKPYLVLHVGPPKTGTSTIQCALAKDALNVTSSSHAKPRYHYLGKSMRIGVKQLEKSCGTIGPFRNNNENVDPSFEREKYLPGNVAYELFDNIDNTTGAYKKLKNLITRKRKYTRFQQSKGHTIIHDNLVLSAEEFSRFDRINDTKQALFAKLWKNELITNNYQIRIIVTYRRYYEIVVSDYYNYFHQIYKAKWPNLSSSPNFKKCERMLRYECVIPTIYEHHEFLYNQENPLSIYNAYKKYFDDVHVFNMLGDETGGEGNVTVRLGGGDTMVTRFICELPNADEECKSIKQRMLQYQTITKGDVSTGHGNSSPSSFYDIPIADRIVIAAYKTRLLLANKISRSNAINAVIARLEEQNLTFQSLPLVCMTKDQEESLLLKSIEIEREMLGNTHNEDLLRAHFNNFRKSEKNHFCSVDGYKIIQDESWQRFFKSL